MTNEEVADQENAAGMMHVRAGRMTEAIPHFRRASELVPDDDVICNNLGAALVESGAFADALDVFNQALSRHPDYAEAHHNRGVALRGLDRYDEAIDAAQEALRLRPDYADGHTGLAMSLVKVGRLEEARSACRRALHLQPRSPLAAMTLGTIVAREGRFARAIELLGEAIALNPALGEAYRLAGILFDRLGQTDQAIACFEMATKLPGRTAESFVALGDALSVKRRRTDAIACFDEALKLEPENAFARVQRLQLLAWQCDWDRLEAEADRIPSLGIEGRAVSPFAMLAREDAPARHRIRSERLAQHAFGSISARPVRPAILKSADRIKVGYFSSDFHDHATAYLAARLFELHDRSRFEIHAFSYGRHSGGLMRSRLSQAFDTFHDVAHLDDAAIAGLARKQGVDVAVDLKGYTEGQRLGILAHRAAAVQISFLGYPGTTGAHFVDYLVADPYVIPDEARDFYTERLIVLPKCYQPTDDQRVVGNCPSREDCGLPNSGFVFASFNQSWKIGREEFAIWTDLLKSVEGSVLWLLKWDSDAERKLQAEAERYGIDPQRIVFAPFVPQQGHLARLSLANLVLDTFNYGSHTTASDALWAGVPIVTRSGRGFAARVATSIVHAIEMPELATKDSAAYASLALALAQDASHLQQVRDKLALNRRTAPLFDSKAYTLAFERGLEAAYRRALAGKAPADIVVTS